MSYGDLDAARKLAEQEAHDREVEEMYRATRSRGRAPVAGTLLGDVQFEQLRKRAAYDFQRALRQRQIARDIKSGAIPIPPAPRPPVPMPPPAVLGADLPPPAPSFFSRLGAMASERPFLTLGAGLLVGLFVGALVTE